MKNRYIYTVVISLVALLHACKTDTVYLLTHTLENNQIHKDSSLVFEYNNASESTMHNITLFFKHTHAFIHKQAVVNFKYTSPKGESSDLTMGIPVRDLSGEFLGKQQNDSTWIVKHTIISKRALPYGQNTFTITNKMDKQLEYVEGISEVGIEIQSTK